MSRTTITSLFLCLFLSLIIAPTVIVAVDDTIDISVVLTNSGDEEEEQGTEEKLVIEFLFTATKELQSSLVIIPLGDGLTYFYKKYPKPYLNIISPPPDTHFI